MKILHLISSSRGDASYSVRLGRAITKQLTDTHSGSNVNELNLSVDPFPHLDDTGITALRSTAATETEKAILQRSDAAVAELFAADVLVIGLPLINFGVPSMLKSWLDYVLRAGVTFSYGADGAKGLVTGKKAYIAIASGAIYSEGPFAAYDHAVPYLKSVLAFIGITDVEVIRAEGTNVPVVQDTALEKALGMIAV